MDFWTIKSGNDIDDFFIYFITCAYSKFLESGFLIQSSVVLKLLDTKNIICQHSYLYHAELNLLTTMFSVLYEKCELMVCDRCTVCPAIDSGKLMMMMTVLYSVF